MFFSSSESRRRSQSPAIIDRLNRFYGVLIFMTSHIAQLDYAFKPYLKPVPFAPLNADQMAQIFVHFLQNSPLANPTTCSEMQDWFQDIITDWAPSGREIRDLVVTSIDRAVAQNRMLELKDVIAAYTARTGRRDFWDFVTEGFSYTDELQNGNLAAEPQVIEKLVREFGATCSIPDDRRLPLVFSKSFFRSMPPESPLQLIDRLSQVTKQLQEFGKFQIVDWGWPRTRWRQRMGCVYQIRIQEASTFSPIETPQMQWEQAKFTFGLRRLLDAGGPDVRCGKPWRRLL
jgi:hypothetical protein